MLTERQTTVTPLSGAIVEDVALDAARLDDEAEPFDLSIPNDVAPVLGTGCIYHPLRDLHFPPPGQHGVSNSQEVAP
jgi:hypothetical protein